MGWVGQRATEKGLWNDRYEEHRSLGGISAESGQTGFHPVAPVRSLCARPLWQPCPNGVMDTPSTAGLNTFQYLKRLVGDITVNPRLFDLRLIFYLSWAMIKDLRESSVAIRNLPFIWKDTKMNDVLQNTESMILFILLSYNWLRAYLWDFNELSAKIDRKCYVDYFLFMFYSMPHFTRRAIYFLETVNIFNKWINKNINCICILNFKFLNIPTKQYQRWKKCVFQKYRKWKIYFL